MADRPYDSPLIGAIMEYVREERRGVGPVQLGQLRRSIEERDNRGPTWNEATKTYDMPKVTDAWIHEQASKYQAAKSAWLASLDRSEPVGIPEIAERLRVERATVDKWRVRGVLPEPRWTVGGRPAWAWGDIRAWAEQTDRL